MERIRIVGAVTLACVLGLATFASARPNANTSVPSRAPVPLFKHLGTHHHPITTPSETVQRYFNQGLRLVYGFNHNEAIRAFREVVRLDPTCAMGYWGIALALGPNINNPISPERAKEAFAAIEKAISLARYASVRERDYVAALSKRYSSNPGNTDRRALDEAYAEAMKRLHLDYPDDLDAATMYAAALMNLRPWDYWTSEGKPQTGTLDLLDALESVLETDSKHIGAIHYYIHAVEASPHPERALPYARHLAAQIPGAGHLVHMPSHIYNRVGLYEEAGEANARAVEIDEAYIEKEQPKGIYPTMYYPHNIDFLWYARQMSGRSSDALSAAQRLAASTNVKVARLVPPLEGWTAMPLCAMVRFGKWSNILDQPKPPEDLRYMTAIWHYARALAFIAQNKIQDAKEEQTQLESVATNVPEDRLMMGRNLAKKLLHIAKNLVAGELAAKQGEMDRAITYLRDAVSSQDSLAYNEPPAWYYPARHNLGAVLIAAGKNNEAEAVYRKDLEKNPQNGWSLFGLWQSLLAQGKESEAKRVEAEYKVSWDKADIHLKESRF